MEKKNPTINLSPRNSHEQLVSWQKSPRRGVWYNWRLCPLPVCGESHSSSPLVSYRQMATTVAMEFPQTVQWRRKRKFRYSGKKMPVSLTFGDCVSYSSLFLWRPYSTKSVDSGDRVRAVAGWWVPSMPTSLMLQHCLFACHCEEAASR